MASVFRGMGTTKVVIAVVLESVGGLTLPLTALWVGLMVDTSVRSGGLSLWLPASAIAATVVLVLLAGAFGIRLRLAISEKVGYALDQELARVVGGIPGITHHETPGFLDALALVREHRQAFAGAIGGLLLLLIQIGRAMVLVVVILVVHPSLLILLGFAAPSALARAYEQRMVRAAEARRAPLQRGADRLMRLCSDGQAAKEVRLLELQDWVQARHNHKWQMSADVLSGARWRGAVAVCAGWLIFAVGFVLVVYLAISRALEGAASLGEVLVTIMIAGQVNGQMAGLVADTSGVRFLLRTLSRVAWIVEFAKTSRLSGTEAAPSAVTSNIRLRAVSFRYPEADTWALRNISLDLPSGSVVAFVGENGAGKSTVVKLLSRLYEPTEGEILVGHTPLSEIAVQSWRSSLAVGFQDFSRFEFLVREAVGVGDVSQIESESAIYKTLVRSGGLELIDQLPSGLNTQLGRSWDCGVELSEGQWQKVALGRTMFRNGVLIRVLDEPTASLDPEQEDALFQRVRQSRGTADVTILVSHRFSTVRAADLIAVFSAGRVIEFGTHHELLELDGLYAELFMLQSSGYRSEPGDPLGSM